MTTSLLQDAPGSSGGDTRPAFLLVFVLAYYGVWMALLTPPSISLALRVAQVAPDNKGTVLSWILAAGALVSMIANPIAGQLSDRTRSRFGMRRPWFIGGAVVGLVGLSLMAGGGVSMIALGWCITQAGLNATLAAITAVFADQIPEHKRGTVSGFLGIAPLVGSLGGAVIANMVGGSMTGLFLVPGMIATVLLLIFAAILKDRTQTTPDHDAWSAIAMLKRFAISPRQNPDFMWAFASRFLLFMGLATLLTYQVYFLTDHLHYASDEVPRAMLFSTAILTSGAILGSISSGWLSDRLQRRKIFVFLAAFIYAIGLLIIGLATDIQTFLCGIAFAGLGQGTYFAVDLALVTEVLPNRDEDAAKDFGIFNLANAVPQSMAPAIAPLILSIGSHSNKSNYTALFIVAALFAAAGAIAITPIRKVR